MSPDKPRTTMRQPDSVTFTDIIHGAPDSALQQAGVTDLNHSGRSIALRELTGIALLRIHSLRPYAEIRTMMTACDITLPAEVNQSLGMDPSALCLAPGDWLLFSEYLGYQRLSSQVRASIEPHHTVALDLSDGYTVFRLSGTGAPWLLNKLSGLDFQKCIAGAPWCARTRMQQVAVTLHYHRPGGLANAPVFDLILDRSMARYLWQLLIASTPHAEELEREFGGST